MRSTYLEVNLKSIINNLNVVRKLTHNNKVIAVVKADGYGLGAVPISQTLIENGVDQLAVALIEEGIELRDHGIDVPILHLGPFQEHDFSNLLIYNITPTLMDVPTAMALNNYCIYQNECHSVHIKVDTGMGRLGVPFQEAFSLILQISTLTNLKIEGVYTHFPSADIHDQEFTNHQLTIFKELIKKCDTIPLKGIAFHSANSGAIALFPESHFDAVRPGLMLYGCYSSNNLKETLSLSKVAALKTEIALIKKLSPGDTVSYGRTFTANHEMKMAVLPVGYADGYPTLFSNQGTVILKNKRIPVIGRVCMDYTIIDVTTIPDAEVGDTVILFGDNGLYEEELAEQVGLIPYEILTGISKRVPRIYIN